MIGEPIEPMWRTFDGEQHLWNVEFARYYVGAQCGLIEPAEMLRLPHSEPQCAECREGAPRQGDSNA